MLYKEKFLLLRYYSVCTVYFVSEKNILLHFNNLVLLSSHLKFSPIIFECKMQKWLAEKTVFSSHLFADIISVHNGNMKHARASEFDYMNLLSMSLLAVNH